MLLLHVLESCLNAALAMTAQVNKWVLYYEDTEKYFINQNLADTDKDHVVNN